MLFALSIGAAEVRLSPETALSPPGSYGPASGNQVRARIVSNGHRFLAVWYDDGAGKLVALPVSPNGAPAATYPTPIASGAFFNVFEVATDGDDYLVVWTDANGTYTLRVDDEARAVGAPRTIGARSESIAIGSDGAGYLVALDGARTLLLDRGGNAVRRLDGTVGDVLWIGAPRGSYEIIDMTVACADSSSCITRFALTSDGRTTELASIAGTNIHAAATATSDAIGLTYGRKDHAITYVRIVDRDGRARASHELAHGFSVYAIGAGNDGQEFLFFATGDKESHAVHVTDSGVHRATTRLTELWRYDAPRVATNGVRELILNTEAHPPFRANDVVVRSLGSFDELAGSAKAILSLGDSAKKGPRLARNGENELAVWVDERTNKIEGLVNGTPFTIPSSAPSIYNDNAIASAAGETNAVVSWYEETGHSAVPALIASRISLTGEVLDRIVVDQSVHSSRETAVGYGGGAYLFAADSFDLERQTDLLRFIRMSESGERLEVRALQEFVSTPDFKGMRIVWNGRDFLATYLLGCCDLMTPHALVWTSKIVRVAGGEPVAVEEHGAETVTSVHAAASSGTHLLMAVGLLYDGLFVATYDRDLTPSSRETATLAAGPLAMPEAVWNGSEFVVAWTENHVVRAMRLNARGVPLDAEPIVIAETPMTRPPALMVVPDGVRIAYEREDPARGYATRIYSRTLKKLEAPSRRRPVR